MEFRLQRDDGAWRWLLERGCPHLGPSGEFVGYIGTCIDITEHRETVGAVARESRALQDAGGIAAADDLDLPARRLHRLRQPAMARLHRAQRSPAAGQRLARAGASRRSRQGADPSGRASSPAATPTTSASASAASTASTAGSRPARCRCATRPAASSSGSARTPTSRISSIAERKLKVQLERMQLLDRTTHAIGAHHELRKVFEVVLRSLEDNLGIDFACVCTLPGRARR